MSHEAVIGQEGSARPRVEEMKYSRETSKVEDGKWSSRDLEGE